MPRHRDLEAERHGVRVAVALSVALLGVLLAGAASAGELWWALLWWDDAHTEAAFLPQSFFDDHTLEEAPLSPHDLGQLKGAMQWATTPPEQINPWRPPPRCRPGHSLGQPWEDKVSLPQDIVRTDRRQVAVLGEIEEVVVGWGGRYEAARLAYVRVDEILRDDEGALESGDLVAFMRTGGRLWIDGVELCNDPDEGYFLPQSGQRVLLYGGLYLLGEYGPADLLSSGYRVFPVHASHVVHQPYGWIAPPPSPGWSIEGLKRELARLESAR